MARLLVAICMLLVAAAAFPAARVRRVSGFPSAEPGYSLGVSACYAGRIGDWLVMAGGCNFPEAGKPKRYYAGIYAARMGRRRLDWQLVGRLPAPAAYGAAVASGDSLLLIGGCNDGGSLRTVYSLHLAGGRAAVRRLADLPYTVDNMAAAQSGGNVYIVGGNHDGSPSPAVLRMSLGAPPDTAATGTWQPMGSVPGSARVQPVSAAVGSRLYVWGGFCASGDSSEVHTDGYCLDTGSGVWTRLEPPRSADGSAMTLTGGIAWTEPGGRLLATGGVCRDIFLDAISSRYTLVSRADYLSQPIEWYRFSGNLYEFDTVHGKWLATTFASRLLARAGAQAVATPYGTYYIGGELKPALRTPQIVLVHNR